MLRLNPASILWTIFLATTASWAFADGTFVWRNQDTDIREPQQKAFIVHADGFQDLVLSVKFEGAAGDFGWLVPLPSSPEMEPAAGPVFETLSKAMQDPFIRTGKTYHRMTMTAGMDEMGLKVSHHDVGIFDVALLEGGGGPQLSAWLSDHGFFIPSGGESVLEHYAQKDWTIAAIRIDPEQMTEQTDGDLRNGEIQPILFRFATAEPVYPLRISSLNGHPSEILLYILGECPQRPTVTKGISWQVSLKPWNQAVAHIDHYYWAGPDFDRTQIHLSTPEPSYLRDLFGKLHDQKDHLWLTKCRATVTPEMMVDLTITDHDIVRALDTGDLQTRVEAVSYLGTIGDREAVPLLLGVLNGPDVPQLDCGNFTHDYPHRPRPGQDIRSAMWALGQIGDPWVVPDLLRWAESDQLLYQLEAFDALQQLDPSTLCDVALSIVERDGRKWKKYSCRGRLYELARNTILSTCGTEFQQSLRTVADHYIETDIFKVDQRRPYNSQAFLGADAIAMAAACGDSAARSLLCRWLTDETASWCRHLEDCDFFEARSQTNSFPSVLYPLSALASGSKIRGKSQEAQAILGPLKERPQLHDGILRQVAATETLSVMGRALLLSEISVITENDIEHLQRLWEQARRTARRVQALYPANHGGCYCSFVVEYDLDVCGVGYALARLGQEKLLLNYWGEIPWAEAGLKGEILAALVSYGSDKDRSQALVSAATEYMRHVWNERIRKLNPHLCYGSSEDLRLSTWPYPYAFDAPHREHKMKHLFGYPNYSQAVTLAGDPTLDPAINLFWLRQSWVWLRRADPQHLEELILQISSNLEDPVLVAYCNLIRARVKELDEQTASR